jgi:Rho-binding antiterminator
MSDRPYQPISCSFHDLLLEKATFKAYCKIQYFSEIQEFQTVNAVIKDVFTRHKAEWMELADGTTVRLDKIVAVDGLLAPNYGHYQDFSCDC